MALSLTSAQQRQLADAIRALASPLAPASAAVWLRTAKHTASAAMGRGTTVFVAPKQTSERPTFEIESPGLDPWMFSEYERHFPYLVRTGAFARSVQLGVVNRHEAYGDRYDDILRSEYTHDFLLPGRSFDAVTLTAPLVPRPRTHRDVVQLGFVSNDRTRSFTDRHTAIARLLYPAFQVGVRTVQHVAGVRSRLRATVDATGAACLVVDRQGTCHHQTPPLSALLAREPHREALLELAMHLGRAFWTPSPRVRHRYAGTRTTYALTATTITDGPEVFCVVRVTPAPTAVPTNLQARFGLTPRQAEVALLLAERRTNREIADALAISVHTARHHVEAVLAALGVQRADIGRLLHSS